MRHWVWMIEEEEATRCHLMPRGEPIFVCWSHFSWINSLPISQPSLSPHLLAGCSPPFTHSTSYTTSFTGKTFAFLHYQLYRKKPLAKLIYGSIGNLISLAIYCEELLPNLYEMNCTSISYLFLNADYFPRWCKRLAFVWSRDLRNFFNYFMDLSIFCFLQPMEH